MVARVAKQAVMPGSQHDLRRVFAGVSKLLFAISVAGVLGLGLMKLNDPQFLPVEKVRAQGAFINLTEAMLLTRAGDINGGYFNVDVRAVQKNIESLAWVDHAYVRKMWPDTLMIGVTEQNVAALWQGKGLINQRGELFYPEEKTFPASLPQLSGPPGSHQSLLEHYRAIRPMLGKTGLVIQQLDMDARRSMIIQFNNGLKILLGRDSYFLRVEKFVRIYEKILRTEINNIQQIDMRYTNGFSIMRRP